LLAWARIGLHRDVRADVGEALERLRVDQRVGGAAVVGEEHVVVGLRVVDHPGAGQRLVDRGEHRRDLRHLGLDRGALGTVTTAMVGELEPPLPNVSSSCFSVS
jgi:hypothetical protein